VCTVDENISDQMICPMPDMNLPQDFIDKLTEDAAKIANQTATKRKRRDIALLQKVCTHHTITIM